MSWYRTSRIFGLVMVLAIMASAPAASAGPAPALGDAHRVSGGGGTSDEANPGVAANGATGDSLVVWEDRRRDDDDHYYQDVFGRVVDAEGIPIGTAFRITSSLDEAFNPAVAWNPVSGEWLVVWVSNRRHHWDVWAQRIDATGARVGKNFLVTPTTTGKDRPDLAADPVTGRWLVVWRDDRDEWTRGTDVYAQVLRVGGRRIRDEFRVSGAAAREDERSPAVAADPGGSGFLVVWGDGRVEDGAIFSQRVKASGRKAGVNIRVSGSGAFYPGSPDVAGRADGKGYLIAWTETDPSDTVLSLVYGRRVRPSGSPRGGRLPIGTEPGREDVLPAVAWDGDRGRWLVAWWNHEVVACDTARCENPTDRHGRVDGRIVKPSGAFAGEIHQLVIGHSMYTYLHPDVTWNASSGRFVVAWIDEWPYEHPKYQARLADTYVRTVGW